MVSKTLQPIISELPISEKRRLLEWLKNEIDEKPIEMNTKLQNKLIKHITRKRKTKNS